MCLLYSCFKLFKSACEIMLWTTKKDVGQPKIIIQMSTGQPSVVRTHLVHRQLKVVTDNQKLRYSCLWDHYLFSFFCVCNGMKATLYGPYAQNYNRRDLTSAVGKLECWLPGLHLTRNTRTIRGSTNAWRMRIYNTPAAQ